MNKSNCAPGGIAAQALRSAERKTEIGRMGWKAALVSMSRRGGLASQAKRSQAERSEAGRRAAKARWK